MSARAPRFDSVETQLFVVAPRYDDLEREELADVLAEYGLSAPRALAPSSSRPMSAARVVATGETSVFVKRHAALLRTVEDLAAEHAFITHLHDRGFPVPRPFTTLAGAAAVVRPAGVYEVHEVAPGEDLYRGEHTWSPFHSLDDAFSAGRALALLHLTAADFDAPARPHSLFESRFDVFGGADLDTALAAWLARHPAAQRFVTTRGLEQDIIEHRRFHERLLPHLEGLPSSWTHNDWQASNLFWHGSDVVSAIDFGLGTRTTPVYDIAIALDRNVFLWLGILSGAADDVRLDAADRLLAGYETIRPLSEQEKEALVALLPLAQAEAGLSALAYYLAVDDAAPAAWAYDVMFGDHTRWFTTPRGREVHAWFRHRLLG